MRSNKLGPAICLCVLADYRWFPQGKVIFLAPTKPLVAQQITACHEVCGIPGADAAELTGDITPVKRAALVSSSANPFSLEADTSV